MSPSQGENGPGNQRKGFLAGHRGLGITPNKAREVLAPGAVAIRGGGIAAVGPQAALSARFHPGAGARLSPGLIIPGLINAHTHAAMSLFRGLAER